MPRTNVYCDQCQKYVENNKVTWFSDLSRDLDFCSENCYLIWKEQFKTPQEWLDRNYFDKEIIFDGDELKFNQPGELVITGYPNLEKILNTENKEIKNITKITISDCPKLKIVDINNFVDNQKLDIINCSGLERLDCNNNQLTNLDLNECQNLKILNCYYNKLTSLEITNLGKLEGLSCCDNFLTGFNLSSSLTFLNMANNKFSEDLSVFSKIKLFNLETLFIGNDYERIKTGDYNSFVGSLESLKDLTKLKKLYISNTDIAGDLRYLPEEVYCSSEGRPESKVKSVEEALKNFESFTFNEGKYTRKKQAYFFREDNFKNFLRRNATKTWFSRNTANARYKSRAGVCELHDYIDKYTVEVKGVLIDPGVKIDEMINQAQQMDMMVHMNAMVCNSIANIGNAFSGGISVSPAITAPSPSAHTIGFVNMKNTYCEKVYFIIAGDKWVTEEVPVNGIKQVAINICEWSNQIWTEKFASPEVQVSEPVDNLISDFSQQLTITPTDYEEVIARKERELERKTKIFDLYVEKKNEEGIERMEQEITKLEEEISKLKLEQKQKQQQTQIEIPPK